VEGAQTKSGHTRGLKTPRKIFWLKKKKGRTIWERINTGAGMVHQKATVRTLNDVAAMGK